MKTLIRNLILILLFLFLSDSVIVYAQQPGQPKIKNISVYSEKFDKMISRKIKNSETNYDSKGNVIEEIEYANNKIDKHAQYQFDESNHMIKEIDLDASGKIIKTTEYKYENGLKTEKSIYGSDGKIKSRKTYVYTTY